MEKTVGGPKLLTIQAAAATLGLSVWTLRSWAYSGKICSNKLGRRLMVPAAEIDRLIAESERPRSIASAREEEKL